MGICIVCEKESDECQCGKAAQKRLQELIAEARKQGVQGSESPRGWTEMHAEVDYHPGVEDPKALQYPAIDAPPEPDEIEFELNSESASHEEKVQGR